MGIKEELKIYISRFKDSVDTFFQYLEKEYGFVKKGMYYLGETDFRDFSVEIIYVGNNLGVKVIFYPAGANVGVSFVEMCNEDMSSKIAFLPVEGVNYIGIDLNTLIEMITNGKQKLPLYWKSVNRRWREIEENMEGIVEEYAKLTKEYVGDILKGDTSIFPEVQRYYAEKIKKEYGWYPGMREN